MPRTIHDVLNNWGEKQRRSPVRNEALKSEILNKFRSTSGRIETIPRRIPWLSLGFATLAILLFLSSTRPEYAMKSGSIAPQTSLRESSRVSRGGDSFYIPNPWPKSDLPISDTREFLKTDYYATIRTRHVEDLTVRAQTMVRGFGGRVDSASSSERSGYISFAIPANKLDAFRAEVKSLVRAKFYLESLSTTNLLPQKQSIEDQQEAAEKNLDNLRGQRETLVKAHNRAVASYQARIKAINQELAPLEAELATADPGRQEQIQTRVQQLQSDRRIVESQQASENQNYKVKLSLLDAQISDAESQLESIKKQDRDLLDTVATVNGTLSFSWISVWEAIDLHLPGPLISWILILGALGAYLWHRRRLQLVVPD